jgi:hypothetical protein
LEKSRFFRGLFRQFHNLLQTIADLIIIFPSVRTETVAAVLNALFCVGKIPAAVFSQGIQRTKTEQTAEGFRISSGMTGEILIFPVLKKVEITHN